MLDWKRNSDSPEQACERKIADTVQHDDDEDDDDDDDEDDDTKCLLAIFTAC